MDDMITIFVKGGEYVDKAAYIQQRTEAGRLREEGVNKDAEVERLRAVVDAARTLLKEGMYNSALAALGGGDE